MIDSLICDLNAAALKSRPARDSFITLPQNRRANLVEKKFPARIDSYDPPQ